eukprot:1270251-Pyramimonas_sp.AAC.1
MTKLRYNDPEKFKSLAKPLVVQKPRTRSRDQLANTLCELEEILIKSTVKRKGKSLLMDKRGYTAWHKLNYGMSIEEAKAAWDHDKADRNVYREVEDGAAVIAVRMPTDKG